MAGAFLLLDHEGEHCLAQALGERQDPVITAGGGVYGRGGRTAEEWSWVRAKDLLTKTVTVVKSCQL